MWDYVEKIAKQAKQKLDARYKFLLPIENFPATLNLVILANMVIYEQIISYVNKFKRKSPLEHYKQSLFDMLYKDFHLNFMMHRVDAFNEYWADYNFLFKTHAGKIYIDL